MSGMTLQEIMAAHLEPLDVGGSAEIPAAPAAAPAAKISNGKFLAGLLADGLLGLAGKPGVVGPMWAAQKQRADEQAQEEANWGRRLQNYEAQKQIDQRYTTPDVSPMERDAAAWQRMGPEQRAAYGQFKSVSSPEPDVVTTLPNGQLYAGPRSGLAAALGGGAQPQRPAIGTVVRDPRMNGGQTPPASGGFRIP